MQEFDPGLLKNLYRPASSSHKGTNGKLFIIAGSQLFHAASLWPLQVASRIVDMVFYSSVDINNKIAERLKEDFKNGIVIPREKIGNYIEEADCILIGPGLPREEGQDAGDDDTRELTEKLLKKYSAKKWVVDGGSLQVIEPEIIPKKSIITPHKGEFKKLFGEEPTDENVQSAAKKFGFVILLKGEHDIVCGPFNSFDRTPDKSAQAVRGFEKPFGSAQGEIRCNRISGGNPGMTKGGTGDVLAGLAASLYCKNDAFLSAACASYINKKAGESLDKKVGIYFNATDLADEIPLVMKDLL